MTFEVKGKIGLYFGTFNPVHLGHLVIANHMAHYTDLDEVWLVVTPHHPHKNPRELMGPGASASDGASRGFGERETSGQ